MLKERRRGGGSRGASTHRVHDGPSLLRSPVPDLGLGHSSEDEAEAWGDDEEVSRMPQQRVSCAGGMFCF